MILGIESEVSKGTVISLRIPINERIHHLIIYKVYGTCSVLPEAPREGRSNRVFLSSIP